MLFGELLSEKFIAVHADIIDEPVGCYFFEFDGCFFEGEETCPLFVFSHLLYYNGGDI